MKRVAQVKRETSETQIDLSLTLDGRGSVDLSIGLPFVEHMFTAFARHGLFDLRVQAKGDLHVDAHHTLEDLGLVLGQVLREALGDRSGIGRFGFACIPMDEALARVTVDLSGRPFLRYAVQAPAVEVGGVQSRLFREFFQAFVNTAGITLHIDLLAGDEVHHCFESIFKALGRALEQAVRPDPRRPGVPSTKGVLA